LLLALARLDDPHAIERALQDLLADSELRSIRERWAIVKLLREGLPQRAVRDAVGCSIATVSRGAALVRDGGLAVLFDALSPSEEEAR
jgi:uncharacterized protein YerC